MCLIFFFDSFYNGSDDRDNTVLRLSNSFPGEIAPEESDVEVKVRMINIRPENNKQLLECCKPLAEYSWLVEEVRINKQSMDIEPAIDKALAEMPKDFMIRPFIEENKAEVKSMFTSEYDEAEVMEMFKKEGREEGIEIGIEKGIELFSFSKKTVG